jgi:hypothetical protein
MEVRSMCHLGRALKGGGGWRSGTRTVDPQALSMKAHGMRVIRKRKMVVPKHHVHVQLVVDELLK